MGLEGIISKQQDAAYRSGRTESWIKVKCGNRDAFPIVAFVEKLGAKPRKIASFYVGLLHGECRPQYSRSAQDETRPWAPPHVVIVGPGFAGLAAAPVDA